MKIGLVAFSALVLGVVAFAQTPAPKTKTAPTKAAPAKSTKKDDTPGKVEGMEIARSSGGFLGLQIAGSNFKLQFYDAKRKPLPADVTQAVMRWQPNYQKNEERILLERSGDGKSLTSARTVRPPYTFKLYITLFKEPTEGTEAVAAENYVVDFAQ